MTDEVGCEPAYLEPLMTDRAHPEGLDPNGGKAQSERVVSDRDRRRFLDLCGKFAVGMPPAVTLLLSPWPGHADHDLGDLGGGVGHSGCVEPGVPPAPPGCS